MGEARVALSDQSKDGHYEEDGFCSGVQRYRLTWNS